MYRKLGGNVYPIFNVSEATELKNEEVGSHPVTL